MPDYPPLSTQVIGQAESALGALLDPLLAGTDRGQLIARISEARKVDGATVGAALTEVTAAGLVTADDPVALTDAGRATYQRIRGPLEQITAQLFDFPAEDLATAGRVLSIVTARANALLARPATATK